MTDPALGRTEFVVVDYETPPVVEVALAIYFEPIAGLRSLDLAPLRERWRDRYPVLEEVPPLPPDDDQPAGLVVQFGPPTLLRYWFVSEDHTRLVQIQRDRMVVNWRAMTNGTDYPRYSNLRENFEQHLHDFSELIAAGQLGLVRITRGEVAYVNDLARRDQDGAFPPLHTLLRGCAPLTDHHLGEPKQTRMELVYEAEPGRLAVQLYPGVHESTGQDALLLSLTYREVVADGSIEGAFQVLDTGHKHIVTSFTELTSAPMHERWGRTL